MLLNILRILASNVLKMVLNIILSIWCAVVIVVGKIYFPRNRFVSFRAILYFARSRMRFHEILCLTHNHVHMWGRELTRSFGIFCEVLYEFLRVEQNGMNFVTIVSN